MADYFEIFDDKRAGIMSALDRAVTAAHAWEFLAHWDPEWEMVALPAIENRLSNFDAYDPDMYSDCFDMIWEIARSDWLTFQENYIEEHPPCRCRQVQGKRADYCWPRYPEEGECAMCEEIRNYTLFYDNYSAERLSRIDSKVTELGDWEFWSEEVPENNQAFQSRVERYGIAEVTRREMNIIHDVARLGWNRFIQDHDPMIDRWGMPVID
jgi:hypothetical protein